ncbi:hypothetical protein [Haloarcula laminariae]|uniref:hypothetical protein n=1 Tax=Haloarcula laminariae TaxID=2961577 RepID=UPI002405B774|nr:hypothetical protein [Halomicroarcula sp. FL173]
MIAGTLFLLDNVVEEPLETSFRNGRLPALEVNGTQETFGDSTVQRGKAAANIVTEAEVPEVATVSGEDRKTLITERREQSERMLVEWVADVTNTGLVLSSSVEGTEFDEFPVDLFLNATGEQAIPQYVDVEGLHIAWDDADELDSTWLNAAEGAEGSTIDYHANAHRDQPASIGLGFGRMWNGMVMRGVVYQSGYIALYSCDVPSDAVQFIAEEILPHCSESEEEVAGGDDGDACSDCGRESDTIEDGLCIVCRDKREEEAEDGQTTIEDLDTVHEAGGGGGD